MKHLYVVAGSEELLRSRAIERLERDITGEVPFDMDREVCDGTETTREGLVLKLRTPPWMAAVRFILIRQGEEWPVKQRELLKEVADGRYPTAVLVLEIPNLKKGMLPPSAGIEIVSCEPPPPGSLPRWIESEAKALGAGIEPEAAFLLGLIAAEADGAILRTAQSALQVLALFTNGMPIRKADVEQFFSGGETISVFKWTDQLYADPLKEVLRGLDRLLHEGQIPLRLIGLLDRHVKILIDPKRAPPFVQGRYAALARHMKDPQKIWGLFEGLAAADFALKNLPIPAPVVMTRLVLEMRGNDL